MLVNFVCYYHYLFLVRETYYVGHELPAFLSEAVLEEESLGYSLLCAVCHHFSLLVYRKLES